MPEPKPPRTPPAMPPVIERVANRLLAELELDTDRIARQFMEGDLHVDAAHVPPEELGGMLEQLWVTKPDQAVAMADAMLAETFFQQVLDTLTDLSPQVKEDFMTMLLGGLTYEDAVMYAQQMHDAEVLARQQFFPLAGGLLPLEEPIGVGPPMRPPGLAPPGVVLGPPPGLAPAPPPPAPPMPGGPPPLPPGIPAMPTLAQMAPLPPGTLPPQPPMMPGGM